MVIPEFWRQCYKGTALLIQTLSHCHIYLKAMEIQTAAYQDIWKKRNAPSIGLNSQETQNEFVRVGQLTGLILKKNLGACLVYKECQAL